MTARLATPGLEAWRAGSPEPVSPQLLEHLRDAAEGYFPELGGEGVEVALRDGIRTSNADVHRFELQSGTHSREVIVKSRRIRSSHVDATPSHEMPAVPDALKVEYEVRALQAIDSHICSLGRSDLGAVRPLEILVPGRVFAMEAAAGENLARSLGQLTRGAEPVASLRASVRNSGAWLRAFHAIPPLAHTTMQPTSRDAFVASLQRIGGFFGPRSRLHDVFQRIESAALQTLPEQLPAGLGHGDFHAANVIAEANGRVRIIDTFAAWSGPIYYDLAHYLYNLKAPLVRQYGQGLRAQPAYVEVAERELLRGYFGDDPVPLEAVRLFEIQWLLYRWGRATLSAQRPGATALGKRARLVLKTRFFSSLLGQLLRSQRPRM